MDKITTCKLEDLQHVQPIEQPLKKKKVRVLLPKSRPAGNDEYADNVSSTPNSMSPRKKGLGRKRAAIPSTSGSSSSIGKQRPLKDEEMNIISYGSEEDSDDDILEDDEIGSAPILVPRAARIFMDEGEHEVQYVDANLSYEWPPRPLPVQTTVKPELATELEQVPDPTFEPTPESVPGVLHKPSSKYDFEWRQFPQPQIEHKLRRETFSNIDCGPTVQLASPYDAFTAIWDRKIMKHIVKETNEYAQQVATKMLMENTMTPHSRITKWHDTNVNEMYVYFAIILATGIVVKSRLEEYWSKAKDIFMTSEFSTTMSYNRFHLLSKCIHFNSNDACNPEVMTRPEAKLHKVQPILDHLNDKFSKLYNLSLNLALDESLIMWKGWLDINQFIRNKAASVGIKSYEVCESKTGYLWRFEIHAGHDISSNPPEDSPVSGIVPTLVLRLLNGLEHKGHTIWMDNYYNSPALARELKVRGFDCVGTLRTNRQFVPTELAKLEKKQMAVGQVCGCTSGDVDLVVWRDKNRVALISTYHGLGTTKCGDTLKPSIIPDYNVCMGGVDRKDQMIAMYPIERRRNRIWYKKLFRRLLNASVLNAYILYKAQHQTTHREFRKSLVKMLLDKHMPHAEPAVPTFMSSGHFPAQYGFITDKNHERQRRVCAVCKKRTNSYCKGCNTPMCVFTCYEVHHTKDSTVTLNENTIIIDTINLGTGIQETSYEQFMYVNM